MITKAGFRRISFKDPLCESFFDIYAMSAIKILFYFNKRVWYYAAGATGWSLQWNMALMKNAE